MQIVVTLNPRIVMVIGKILYSSSKKVSHDGRIKKKRL
jgi:hypothetical protein